MVQAERITGSISATRRLARTRIRLGCLCLVEIDATGRTGSVATCSAGGTSWRASRRKDVVEGNLLRCGRGRTVRMRSR